MENPLLVDVLPSGKRMTSMGHVSLLGIPMEQGSCLGTTLWESLTPFVSKVNSASQTALILKKVEFWLEAPGERTKK